MAKSKGPPIVVNKAVYTRASYLFQAAHYLVQLPEKQAANLQDTTSPQEHSTQNLQREKEQRAAKNLSRQMVSDMRVMTLKGVVRQSPAMKRSLCKFCDTVLIEGESCRSTVENPSKGGRKPWADVLVVRCLTCDNVKRYPVSARKQKRKHLRPEQKSEQTTEQTTEQSGEQMETEHSTPGT